jgi:hypothetical protein
VSFASLAASWTPRWRHQHTCAISGLYGVTGVHSKETCTTPSTPDRASKHPYDSFSMNRDIGHLVVMIIILVTEALST